MRSNAYTSAGTLLSASQDLPTTATLDEFDILQYSAIGDLSDIGEFRESKQVLTYYEVGNSKPKKKIGNSSFDNISLRMANLRDDEGQSILHTAFNNGQEVSIKIDVKEPHTYYFTGLVTSYSVSIGGADQIVSAEATIELTSDVIVDQDIIDF